MLWRILSATSPSTLTRRQQALEIKPYRIDFKYSTDHQASFTVCAKNEKEARAGAEVMLAGVAATGNYNDPEIVCVEEHKDYGSDDDQTPTLN
jgi:hypothetical protein